MSMMRTSTFADATDLVLDAGALLNHGTVYTCFTCDRYREKIPHLLLEQALEQDADLTRDEAAGSDAYA